MSAGPQSGDAFEGGDAALAAEYALGLLPAAEARAFEARLAVEPALVAELALWQGRLAELAEAEIAPVIPPARVKRDLEDRLFGPPERVGLWRSLGFWRAVAGLALAATVALAVLLAQRPAPPSFAPGLIAQIRGEGAEAPRVLAALDPLQSRLALDLSRAAAAPGRVLELWLIPPGAAPVSLGVLPEVERAVLPVPPALLPAFRGGVLAISDEPPGGSPTGAPTGAVLATGEIAGA